MSLKGVISDKEIQAMKRLEDLSNKADGKISIHKKKRNESQRKQKNRGEKKTLCFYGIPLNGNTLFNALYILAFIAASCVLSDALSIHKNNIWVNCSLVFLVLSGCLYHFSKTSDIESKDIKIAELNQRIHTLEDIRECDKNIIALLEKELERVRNNSINKDT